MLQKTTKNLSSLGLAVALCCFQVPGTAQGYPGPGPNLAVNHTAVTGHSLSAITLKDLLNDLKNTHGIQFSYQASLAEDLKLLVPSTYAEEKNVDAFLGKTLATNNLGYKKVKGVYIISRAKQARAAAAPVRPAATPVADVVQDVSVSGKVTDETGSPLPGVTVVLKGTSKGTSTNVNGEFTLPVPASGGTLVFSFIGYSTQEVAIGNQSTIQVTMRTDAQALQEVVVVGYGTQRRQDITGSVASISPKEFNAGVVSTPDQLLVGKVAGLTINRSSGDPTSSPSIQLRGPSSLTAGTSPFYVIDGVPGASIDLVSPDEIESIDVLKDASATAIYGSRAANGVIMVTTKRGKAGKPTLSYSGYGAVQTIARNVNVLSADEYRAFLQENNLQVAENEGGHSTNWQDEIFRTGISQNHTLSLTGGNEGTRYNASVNYFKDEGIVKKNDLERIISRVGIDQDAFNGKAHIMLNLTNSMINSSHIDYGIFNGAARFLPVSPVRSDDPQYARYGGYFQVPGRINYNNPVSQLNLRDEERSRNITLGTAKVGVDIARGLTFDITGSIQRENYDRNYYMSRFDFAPNALGVGYAERIGVKHTDKILESTLNYATTLAEKHEIKLLAGYSYQDFLRNDGLSARNIGFSSDALSGNNLSTGSTDYAQTFRGYPIKEMSKLISFFGRVNYSFNEKYILSATLRRDGSSRFGINNRWATFPSVSAAWRIIEEGFMQDIALFSDLKLRAGYGISGNQNIPPYRSITLYGPQEDQFLYNGGYINSYSVIQNANPNLKWESTAMANVGIDFGLFQGKVNGTLEYYHKKTEDLLYEYDVPTPPYQFNRLLANGATMLNRGIEVSLNAELVRTDKFTWNSSANFARNKNEIGSLSSNVGNLTVSQRREGFIGLDGWTGQSVSLVQPGLALGTFYTARYVGYDSELKKTIYLRPDGELITSDQIRTPDDFQVVGNALPKFTYGWSNSFTYDRFDLNFFLRGVYGNKIFNATRADLSRLNQVTSYNITPEAIEDGIFEAPMASSRWIEDGSFIRLDNATLGYTFNVESLNFINSARIYVTGQNLFTITKYTGVDPEVNLGGLAPGIDDRNYYPRTRSFMLGANFNF